MLLDSNVIIYAARPEYAALREFIEAEAPAVSVISRIEVLGYHKLTKPTESFCNDSSNLRRFCRCPKRLCNPQST